MNTISNEPACPQCGKPVSLNALEGLCPACLMQAGFGTLTEGAEREKPAAFVPPTLHELAGHFPQLEILELLGHGGMGAVYKARQTHLDRIVALKILPPGIGHAPAFAERFVREARALAQLHHPNIVTLYESGQADELFYFLMEFVDGMNLRQLLAAGIVFPQVALAIVPQICDALQFAHDRGIVHRDIKPENILLSKTGQVKIADFGVAKLIAGEPASSGLPPQDSQSEVGKVIGTPQYMAPEQLSHPLDVDNRADIYALGVVFYQMLTGELPAGKFEPPSRKVQVDVRLDEVVLRAMEKKPELRYQQASIMKTQVEAITSPQPSSGSPIAPRGPKRLVLATSVAGGILMLAVLGFAILLRSTPATPVQVDEKTSSVAHRGVLEAELQQAQAIVARQKPDYDNGTISLPEYQVSKGKVAILEAELTGDPVKIAQTHLSIAQWQFKFISNLYQNGMLSDPSDYEKAKGDVAIAEAQLREAQPASPMAVTTTTVRKGDLEVYVNSLGMVAPPDNSPPTSPADANKHQVSVKFTIPEDDVQAVLSKFDTRQPLPVEAYSRSGFADKIGEGFLVGVGNQIDASTGTLTCKGMIVTPKETILLPNMMLNIRMLMETRHEVTLLATKAIQNNAQGSFVYLIKPGRTVAAQPVTRGMMSVGGEMMEIKEGLSPGETVVLDVPDGMQEGSRIR